MRGEARYIGQTPVFAIVSSRIIPQRTYLDHAATSPLRPEARAAMEDGLRHWANPSSPHAEGRKARALLEGARDRIRNALGWPGEVIFTSGASEALAIGLRQAKADRRILSAVEHDAVLRAAPGADRIGLDRCDLDVAALQAAMAGSERPVVAVQSVNSECGAVLMADADNPAQAAIAHSGGLLLRDCSQSAGKEPLPDADMIVISAHKFGGPVGIGALLVKDFASLDPVGGHERGYRAGTENLPGALGMAAAMEAGGLESWATSGAERQAFREALESGRGGIVPGKFCSHIIAVAHPSLSAQACLIRLDAHGFAVSAGSACSSGTLRPSRVLEAFGVQPDVAARTLRISLGWSTTPQDLDWFLETWAKLL